MESQSESYFVVHNEGKTAFEIALGGWTAFAEYRVDGDRMIFTHTEVPEQFRGRGIAKKLVLAGFEVAEKKATLQSFRFAVTSPACYRSTPSSVEVYCRANAEGGLTSLRPAASPSPAGEWPNDVH